MKIANWMARQSWCRTFVYRAGKLDYNESFNAKLRDELLNREIFYTLKEAKAMIERWRHEYNTVRPHSSLGYRPPTPETIAWREFPPTPHTHDGPILTFKVDRL